MMIWGYEYYDDDAHDDDDDDDGDANEGVRQMWSEPESWSLRLQPHLSGTKVSISVMITMIVTTILMMIAIIGGILRNYLSEWWIL